MHAWQFPEAKKRFCEVVELTLKEGGQLVIRGVAEAVVLLAVDDYRRLCGQTQVFKECLLNAPRGNEFPLERSPDLIHDLPLWNIY
jgi:antitoxin Phd